MINCPTLLISDFEKVSISQLYATVKEMEN